MEVQHPIVEIRSLQPIQALSPIYSVQQRPWFRVYRAEAMIPFLTYSVKVVYIITFIAFKIFVRIELYMVYMVQPAQLAIEEDHGVIQKLGGPISVLPIACYSFNCIYCARCNLGLSCKSHIPPPMKKTNNNLDSSS